MWCALLRTRRTRAMSPLRFLFADSGKHARTSFFKIFCSEPRRRPRFGGRKSKGANAVTEFLLAPASAKRIDRPRANLLAPALLTWIPARVDDFCVDCLL